MTKVSLDGESIFVIREFMPPAECDAFIGAFARPNGERSELTFMVYLNDDFAGGATRFFHLDRTLRMSVQPERGSALVFVHRQLHEGSAVDSGRKYVLRTDVMYAEGP